MQLPSIPDPELLKTILEPLFDDFTYWLTRSESLLRTEKLSFLKETEQAEVLQRVQQSLKEVDASRSLFRVTGGQVGVDASILMTWHQLIAECWKLSIRFRQEKPGYEGDRSA